MDSLILCYSPEDEVFARRLAGFIEANLTIAVSLTEGVVGPELDLVEAAERALSAEAALVLLSPLSVPRVWNRKLWEPVFVDKPREFQSHLGFVLLADCAFPAILRRQRFFDASRDALAALRDIKRWLLRPMAVPGPAAPVAPEFGELRSAIADRPGAVFEVAAGAAIDFAAACRDDFEAVFRFDCGGRTRAGIVGDIGSALGLALPGNVEKSRAALAGWCAVHRVLFVLAEVKPGDRDFVAFGGRASVLCTGRLAGSLPGAVESAAAAAVRRFDRRLRLEDGWIAVNLLKVQERNAEVLEVLEAMSRLARALGEENALRRIEREQFWFRGGDGVLAASSVPGQDEQLTLPFE